MCGGPEHMKPASPCDKGRESSIKMADNFSSKVKEIAESCSSLHELAANNDLIGFKKAMEEEGSKVDEVNLWYCRQNGSNQMVLEHRTPLMVAALYGSVDVLNYILSIYVTCGADVNQACGSDKTTALHCAAGGGSSCVLETVKLLIQSGAEVTCLDGFGRRPADVIMVSPKLTQVKTNLEGMLDTAGIAVSSPIKVPNMVLGPHGGESNGTELVSPSNLFSLSAHADNISPPSGYAHSPTSSPKFLEATKHFGDGNEKKEYPVDPSLPDIKNSIYTTDEFRMFSFKVRPCSRAYSHDWTECPFVHPGENARRRDPRRYHYSCVPCPDFRKGSCRRGDMCEYAHGVFECWLHPAQYRTRLCKDGTSCARRVCFFAHTSEELRPLFVSTGSAVPSPRASSSLDMASVMSSLAPGSPSSVSIVSPFSLSNTQQGSVLTPPMSPSASSVNGLGHSSMAGGWPQPNVPTLSLPGSNFQTSRLRAELNARDMPHEDSRISDFDGQLLNEFSPLSTQARMNAATAVMSVSGNTSTRNGKYKTHGITTVAPTNLEDLFASEITSPRVPVLESSIFSQMSPQMQAHKTTHVYNQLQNQMLPPINTQTFSQGTTQLQQALLDPQSPGHHSLIQSPFQSSSFGLASPGRMSSQCLDVERHSSNGSTLSPVMAASLNSRTAAFIQREKRSLSSRELGAHVPLGSLSDWGSPTGKLDWGVHGEELNKFRKSASFGPRSYEEPDLSWVQTLVKETTPDSKDGANVSCSGETPNKGQMDNADHSVLGAWIEQLQLDQIVA